MSRHGGLGAVSSGIVATDGAMVAGRGFSAFCRGLWEIESG